ncbi:hypothetical protein ACSBRB_10685, partial [Staphylococcus auricularis]|uniref:hypothetical protein n=1 Tax=Staphylococcus auricularis TaxID=29379 RepID=UPI003EB8003A
NLPITGDKLTVMYWIKATSVFNTELSVNSDITPNTFHIFQDNTIGRGTTINDRSTVLNSKRTTTAINTGVWFHFAVVFDRSLDALNSTKVY